MKLMLIACMLPVCAFAQDWKEGFYAVKSQLGTKEMAFVGQDDRTLRQIMDQKGGFRDVVRYGILVEHGSYVPAVFINGEMKAFRTQQRFSDGSYLTLDKDTFEYVAGPFDSPEEAGFGSN